MFWTGFVVGLLVGMPIGVFLMALCVVSRCDRPREKAALYIVRADPAQLDED